MSASIDIYLKRAVVVLSEERSYARAGKKLNMKPSDLKRCISALERELCLHIFRSHRKKLELTEEGEYLAREFRNSVALHDRTNQARSKQE